MKDAQWRGLLSRLSQIGAALSSVRDLGTLLDMIVEQTRALTNADGGTLFLVDDEAKALRWSIIQNESMLVRIGGPHGEPPQTDVFRPIPLARPDGTPRLENVATYVAHTASPVSIADVYDEFDEFDFAGPLRFDRETGYRTRSMLVVPLRHFEGGVIGVLQLINARNASGEAIEFDPDYLELTLSIAGQAAVAVKNAQLFLELEAQFEAFIQTIAMAIDEKSAYTAGHVRRVVDIAMAMAEAVHHCDQAPYADVTFSSEELHALKIASWMHDVGKIATPEHVVDKPTKLSTIFDRIELLKTRYEVLRRDAQIAYLEAMAQGAGPEHARQRDETLAELDEELDFLITCNQGSEFMSDDDVARIHAIAAKTYLQGGQQLPRLTSDEVLNLTIRRGTLTSDEIEIIRDHAAISYRMLSQLPFERHLSEVPEIAAGHHEKLNGKGYPRGLTAEQLSLPARILAIADIFEALTAADRPYKKPTPLSGVHRILGFMHADGELDPDLLSLAMRSGVFDDYALREVAESQRDLIFREVDPW